MPRARPEHRLAPLVRPYFWVPVAAGLLLVVLAAAGLPALLIALLATALLILGGLIASVTTRSPAQPNSDERSAVPPELASDTKLVRLYRILRDALASVAGRPDGAHKEAVTQRLIALGVQFRALASGTNEAPGSESWYVAHDAVLTIPDLKEYRAVVWVRDAECTRDPATQESLRATLAAARRGVLVERILVLPDVLWTDPQMLPVEDVRPWIEDQQAHGFRIILVRERELTTDAGSLSDTCVFGDWAVGTRDLDGQRQTVRVALDFSPAAVRTALERLDRLSRIGIPFGDLLERNGRGG